MKSLYTQALQQVRDMALETGSVILIGTKSGRKLAVVQGRKRVSWIPGWRGYYVWIDGVYDSVPEEAIVDRSPPCPYCGRNQWYLSGGAELYLVEKVLCRSCHPPLPNWEDAWRKLDLMLDRLAADDQVRSTLQQTLDLCDQAFEAGDWLTFKRGTYAIGLAIALRTGMWNPYHGEGQEGQK